MCLGPPGISKKQIEPQTCRANTAQLYKRSSPVDSTLNALSSSFPTNKRSSFPTQSKNARSGQRKTLFSLPHPSLLLASRDRPSLLHHEHFDLGPTGTNLRETLRRLGMVMVPSIACYFFSFLRFQSVLGVPLTTPWLTDLFLFRV